MIATPVVWKIWDVEPKSSDLSCDDDRLEKFG
jgi:hypothetical protein